MYIEQDRLQTERNIEKIRNQLGLAVDEEPGEEIVPEAVLGEGSGSRSGSGSGSSPSVRSNSSDTYVTCLCCSGISIMLFKVFYIVCCTVILPFYGYCWERFALVRFIVYIALVYFSISVWTAIGKMKI